MARFLIALAIAWLGVAAAMPARSAPVTVGRASTETPAEQDWQIHPLSASRAGVTGGVDGELQVASTALWLVSPKGAVQAVLILEGTKTSFPDRLQWGASCEGIEASETMYVRNRWRNMWSEWRDDCLVVGGPFDLPGSLQHIDPAVATLMNEKGAKLAGAGYVVRARVAQNGTFLEAWLFADISFRGSSRPLSVDLGKAKLPPAVIQWGAELSSAIQSSTLSVSGKFELPHIGFDDVAPTTPRRIAAQDDAGGS